MQKKTFIIFFFTVHVIFLCALIDKQSRIIKLSYQKQAYEQKIKVLKAKKEQITHTLYALQNKQKIKNYALHELKMNPLLLKNVKTVSRPEKS